jgi:hypothetical protein
MHPAVREFYNLEEVWGGKTVRVNAAAKKKKPPAKKRAKAKRPRSKR